MRNKQIILFVLLSLMLAIYFIVLSCSKNYSELAENDSFNNVTASKTTLEEIDVTNNTPMEIVVTIPPQAEFVEMIAEDKANVTIMVPPGASPHTYEPRRSQLVNLSNAVLYAKVGTPIEFEINWLYKIKEMNKDMIIVDCSKNIELIESNHLHEEYNSDHNQKENNNHILEDHSHEGLHDPHIWLSLNNAAVMVENIYEALILIDPSNKNFYNSNMNKYIREIKKLDGEITEMFKDMENNKFMVYHDAWAYFARDYDLVQIPIEKDGKEPTPKGIRQLIDQARKEEITVVFASPELNISSAQVIAEEINGAVVLISPLEQNYLENMRNISNAIYKHLSK